MSGFESVERGGLSLNRAWLGSFGRLPRWVRELGVIVGVSGAVLLFSGPVRGELADKIAARTLVGMEAWARDLLVPDWIPEAVWDVGIALLALVGFSVLVFLLAAGVQTVGRLQQYAFNGVIERRFAVVPMRYHVLATALPLTLGLALACKGPAAICACVLFAVLLTAIRMTVGRDYEVFVSPPEHVERKPSRPMEPDTSLPFAALHDDDAYGEDM
jgi:hypothetical protein